MRLAWTGLVFATIAALAGPGPAPAQAQAFGMGLDAGLRAARDGDWQAADEKAAADGAVAREIIVWTRLRNGVGQIGEYLDFFERRADWPGLKYMRRQGEPLIPADLPAEDVLRYFGTAAPQTGRGALRLVAAYKAQGMDADAEIEAVLAWRTLAMDSQDKAAFLDRYNDWVAPHHVARLDMLLWRGRTQEAERMLPLVDAGWQALARARIGLRRDAGGVDTLIGKVPDSLQDNPGLAYERFEWRARKGRDDDAIALMLSRSTSAADLGEPDKWAGRRRSYARNRMRAGAVETAYQLASRHFLNEGQSYSDLEWLSGYLALTYLDDAELALEHFERFRDAVFTPISLGRAGYWQGRAHEAMGNAEAAMAAYRFGARYQTSFYGQLAAEKAGVPMHPSMAAAPGPANVAGTSFATSSVIEAGRVLLASGRRSRAEQFLAHQAETVPEEEFDAYVDLVASLRDPHLLVVIGKQAAQRGMPIPKAYFAMGDLGLDNLPVPRELAMAIARRESEFDPVVVSPAGARGLMQLMPATARQVSAELGLSYSRDKLTSDPVYNATLGSAFLATLIKEFGDTYPLVAAGYNAGASRPRRWMERFGDPRRDNVDAVDWIEHIPFRETRNYVMRVMEAHTVYQARLAGKVLPMRLSQQIKGR